MNVLVVGGGGREHAIVRKLYQSSQVGTIFAAPGNAGIGELAQCIGVKATDLDKQVLLAKEMEVDYVVVAPDDPLAMGLVDKLEKNGIPAFGPSADAAIIEASKVYSKQLMSAYGIPTARYRAFDEEYAAIEYIRAVGAPIVVKADGLALGKGVTVCATVAEAEAAVREMMSDGRFGEAGAKCVIEECMTGPEVTVLCFTDGITIRPMPSSQDHKRAMDGDMGPNTGGMGAIAPVPIYTPEIAQRCMEEIFIPTVAALNAEGRTFRGVLYFGLMLTPDGPKVVEYNARFGDPETQAVLSLLDSDLMEIMMACTTGTLDQVDIRWKDKSACCVVVASEGYPGKYETGKEITGILDSPATVYHAGTRRDEQNRIYSAGGRVLGVTATGDDLPAAIKAAYAGIAPIHFDGMTYRHDIGGRYMEDGK